MVNDVPRILSSFEELVELDIQEGRLQRNDETHAHYLRAFRIALEAAIRHRDEGLESQNMI